MQNFMKRVSCLLLVAVFLTGCSDKTEKVKKSIDIIKLQDVMVAADDTLPEVMKVSSKNADASDLFSYLADMDYKKVKNFFLVYASSGDADEIAVIECGNKEDTEEALSALKKHSQKRVNLYSSYRPKQVSRAQNALIFSRDNYAVLIASDKQMDVKTAFEKAVSEAK